MEFFKKITIENNCNKMRVKTCPEIMLIYVRNLGLRKKLL